MDERAETVLEFAVPAGQEAGVRLDVYLTERIANATRAKVQRGIRDGRVEVNGRVESRSSYGVQPGDVIRCRILRPPPVDIQPEDIPLDIHYEDEHLLVVDKPAGMVVHPAYGHRSGTLVNALLHHVGAGAIRADPDSAGEILGADDDDDEVTGLSSAGAGSRYEGDPTIRPGLVHRLDRDTTGLMVIAKTDDAHAALARQFAERTIRRRYLAIVWGVPEIAAGRVETWLGRDPRDRKRVAVVPEGKGKWAATNWEVEERLAHTSLLAFQLETGRTHQIRVHALQIGHPILGDATYGGNRIRQGQITAARKAFFDDIFARLRRQALHAATLGFRHPATGENVDFESPPPRDFEWALERLRQVEGR